MASPRTPQTTVLASGTVQEKQQKKGSKKVIQPEEEGNSSQENVSSNENIPSFAEIEQRVNKRSAQSKSTETQPPRSHPILNPR